MSLSQKEIAVRFLELAAAGEVDEVEARLRRRGGEVGDRHPVAVRDAAAVPLERGERLAQRFCRAR